jgi:Collagen triple helix repeat (20 copies)
MKNLIVLFLILAACERGAQGIQGGNGTNGTNGIDGTNGTNGATGAQGPQGPQGIPGSTGAQGPAGADGTQITVVQFCPGTPSYPSTFPETGLCINGNIYAVYSKNDGFLTEIPPGLYRSNAVSSSCTFAVGANCQILN